MKIFLTIILIVFTLDGKSLFSNDLQVQNSKYISALKDLILSTQKTRGLTNNYLNGNTVSMLLVYDSRENMKEAIRKMESFHFSSDPLINSRAAKISESLIKLNRKAFKKDSDFVFEAYTQQIEQILKLAQTVSKRSYEDFNPLGRELSVVMMEVMLPLTEYIGQMRGIGSGIVAKKEITKIELLHMQAISSKVQEYTSKLINTIKSIRTKHSENCDATMETKLKKIKIASHKYIELTNKEILKKNQISYDTDKYFEDGTSLISKVIEIYDLTNKVIINDSKGWL